MRRGVLETVLYYTVPYIWTAIFYKAIREMPVSVHPYDRKVDPQVSTANVLQYTMTRGRRHQMACDLLLLLVYGFSCLPKHCTINYVRRISTFFDTLSKWQSFIYVVAAYSMVFGKGVLCQRDIWIAAIII